MILSNQSNVLRKDAEVNIVRDPVACKIWPFPRIVINNGREKDQIFSLLSIAVRIGSVMTTKHANHPQQYLCIHESVGKLIYRYYNEVLSDEEARSFEEHLLLCFRCQDVLFALDSIVEALRADPQHWFGPKEGTEKINSLKIESKS
jgi:hypothetical protein